MHEHTKKDLEPLIEETPRHAKQKIHNKPHTKKASHKHDYSIPIVVIRRFSHVDLITHGFMCSICGKHGGQKYFWNKHFDSYVDTVTGARRISEYGIQQVKELVPGCIVIYEKGW